MAAELYNESVQSQNYSLVFSPNTAESKIWNSLMKSFKSLHLAGIDLVNTTSEAMENAWVLVLADKE